MKALLLLAATLGTLQASQIPIWQSDLANLSKWVICANGGAEATTTSEDRAAKFTSRSALAPNVWLSMTSKQTFPVKAGEEATITVRAKGEGAGRAFVCLTFEPAGGQSRFYLPGGAFDWKEVSQTVPIPPEAATARVLIGVESETSALWVSSISITPPATPRTNLAAHWQNRTHPRVFPQAKPPSTELTGLDVSKLNRDELLLATTLQGLINTTQPRIYLYHNDRDRFWARWLVEGGYIKVFHDVPDLSALIAAYRKDIPGVIAYDPALPASVHAAVMIGSMEGLPATSISTAEKFQLPVSTNLAGRWKRNVDAYRDVWTKYRDRFEQHVLAVHHPEMTQQGPRDYFVQQKIFTFWVSGNADNEPGADPSAELDFAHEVLASTPPNIPIMGWWSFGDHKGLLEYDAVRLSSSYAKYLAGSEFCTNLSVLSGIPAGAAFTQRKTPAISAPEKKLAVSLSVLDSGDSQWYWQQYQPGFWEDPARGKTPINWSLNPTVADIMPPLLAWFYKTATPNDLFFCALSGLGYMNPRVYASRFRPEDRERIWSEYVEETGHYMKELDLSLVELYAGSWSEPRGAMEEIYRRFTKGIPDLKGILSDFGRQDDTTGDNAVEIVDGKPVFHTLMRWLTWTQQDQLSSQLNKESESVDFTVKELLDHAPTQRPAVMSGLILSWTMSPKLVKRVAEKLPPDVQLMNADQLVERWKQLPTK